MLLMAPLLEDLLMARNTDIHTSTLRVFDQYEQVLPRANIDFRISPGDSRVWGNDLEPCQGKTPHSTISLPRNLRKGESNSQGTKQTDWKVIIHGNSSPFSAIFNINRFRN